jgi:hypothetical protein
MTNATLIADALDDLAYRIDSFSSIADELRSLVTEVEQSENYYPRGTILKALPTQARFKPKSMWVSLGDGNYRHLNGKKGLVTTHDRLDGYTEVIFSA